MSASLPVFPWDTLADAAAVARAHPDGVVDLSVGTPVDPVDPVIQQALARAAAAPGYPLTAGTPRLRAAAVSALARRHGVSGLDERAVLPVIGSKELIAWLPTLLGLGPEDLVVIPELAYPTYAVGARLAGCPLTATDALIGLGPQVPALVYLNSPANPTGRVLGVEHLRKVVAWHRYPGLLRHHHGLSRSACLHRTGAPAQLSARCARRRARTGDRCHHRGGGRHGLAAGAAVRSHSRLCPGLSRVHQSAHGARAWRGWPGGESWWRPAISTDPPEPGTSGLR
ncbi:MAG: aminotransferase class I/II-fold pyridoxal phosphate-dependent enzyme [Mycobacteriaceae bacterium]|nr:aminotransferase class I/II-fold pyridoxal phosphate-dependent enzyme [Mycobacteriaceae bacterium]